MPENIDAVFAQLRKDVEAATSPEHRQVAVDKAELAVKSIVVRLLSRDGVAAATTLPGLVKIKRQN